MVAVINVSRVRKCAVTFSLGRAVNDHEVVRIFHRTRPQRHGVKGSEYGRVYANADRQSNHGGGCESWALAQHAHSKAQILPQAFEIPYATRVAAFFLRALDAAKLNPRPPQRFFARHAGAYQIFRERLDVKAQLRIHLVFYSRASSHRTQPRPNSAPKHHVSSLI